MTATLNSIDQTHLKSSTQLLRRCALSIGTLSALFVALTVHAEEPEQTRTEVQFKHVMPASHMLGMPVVKHGTDQQPNERVLGIVRDLLIDINSAEVPVAVVEKTRTADSELWVLPLSIGTIRQNEQEAAVWELSKENIAAMKKTSLTARELPANAEQASRWFQVFSLSPPWKKDVNSSQPVEFTSLRKLFWQHVQSGKGENLGTITEFVIAPAQRQLAYTLLTPQSASEPTRPDEVDKSPRLVVPLAAYVQTKDQRTWRLDIPKAEMSVEHRIAFDSFPRSIPRAWIEYVSVRYGSDVERGIQPASQAVTK